MSVHHGGSSQKRWTNWTEHYSETSIHYVVEREKKKMQENKRCGKELKYVRNARKLQTMEIINFTLITTKIIKKKKFYINT